MNDLLAQHKEIKRLERKWEKSKKELEEDFARQDEEARLREVEDFEKGLQGLESKRKRDADDEENGREKRRKEFELDEAELRRIAREKREQTMKEIAKEKVRDI